MLRALTAHGRMAAVCAIHLAVCIADGYAADDEAAFFINGILAERQRVQSARVHVTGTRAIRDIESGKVRSSRKFEAKYAFDRDRVYVESTEPGKMLADGTQKPPKFVTAERVRRYFRTPERSVTWIEGEPAMYIRGPDAPMLGEFLFFDVRALGVYSWRELLKGSRLEEVLERQLNRPCVKTVDRSHGEEVIVAFSGKTEGPHEYDLRWWMRPGDSFSVVRTELRTRPLNRETDKWRELDRQVTSWKNTNGVCVPVHCEMYLPQRQSLQELIIEAEWTAINIPLDSELFRWENFGAPPTVEVRDLTSDKTVVIQAANTATVKTVQMPYGRWLFFAANILVVVALGYAYWRTRHSSLEA